MGLVAAETNVALAIWNQLGEISTQELLRVGLKALLAPFSWAVYNAPAVAWKGSPEAVGLLERFFP